MKISGIETLRFDELPNLLFVQVETSEGLTGLGETYFGATAVEAYIHDTAAPLLLGEDALAIDRHANTLYGYLGYRGPGAETRGNSAIDIALWDLLGKASDQPVYQLLGGRSRANVRVYNTCAGYEYMRRQPYQSVSNWGLPAEDGWAAKGPYEDLDGFLRRADELARSLLEEGITAMKMWPFDVYAEQTGGHYIRHEDLKQGLEPFRKVREAVGSDIDIMVEFHSLWDLPSAKRIAAALTEYEPFWFEDPVKADNFDALADYAVATDVPVTLSETLAGRWAFRDLLQRRIAGVVMLDVGWCGGLSEAKKISSLAEACQLPVAPHDCTGPVVLTASTHLAVNIPNALVQEMVRAYYWGWYRELLTELPIVEGGYIRPPDGAGLGVGLQPDLRRRKGVHVRRTEAEG